MTAMILLSEWQRSQVEFWRPIQEFDGYDVSNFGRVRSWRTIRPLPNHGGTEGVRRKAPRILKSNTPKAGYPVVGLGRTMFNNKGRAKTIHRLVALAFIPNPENKPTVNHLTGLRTDARADGLTWATRKEQAQHAWKYGLQKRDRYAHAKKMVEARKGLYDIPDVMVHMIRAMLKDGISQGQIRRWSGLKWTAIQNLAVGRTYRDVA